MMFSGFRSQWIIFIFFI